MKLSEVAFLTFVVSFINFIFNYLGIQTGKDYFLGAMIGSIIIMLIGLMLEVKRK